MLLNERKLSTINHIRVQFHYINAIGCALFVNQCMYYLVFFISRSIQDLSIFSGKPEVNCNDVKSQTERRPCQNVPECKNEVVILCSEHMYINFS